MRKAILLYEGSYQFNVVPTNGTDNKAQVESLLALADSHRHSDEGYWATVCTVEEDGRVVEELERYVFDPETGKATLKTFNKGEGA